MRRVFEWATSSFYKKKDKAPGGKIIYFGPVRKKGKLIRDAHGFTLAETLLAVLILLMVSGIVAAGIPVAKNAYEKVVLAADAQLLLSTTVAELRDEIGTSWDVEVDPSDSTKVYYFSASTGAKTELFSVNSFGSSPGIYITDYAKSVQDSSAVVDAFGKVRPLVTNAASTKKMYATYSSVELEGNVIRFIDLKVQSSQNTNHDLAVYGKEGTGESGTLSIRFMKSKAGSDG